NQLEEEMVPAILDREQASNDRRRTIRGFRLYRDQQVVDPLLELIAREDDEKELRLLATEALGWYVFSYQREAIVNELARIREQTPEGDALHTELTRSINRLTHKPNHPFTL
ncbi:MAG: HEAT repeat domain-containing protein, partial [Bacteroidota bacterium]